MAVAAQSERTIITYYFTDSTRNEVLKTNRSKYCRNAVMNAVDALSFNHYGAAVAVVYDDETGKDHAVIVVTSMVA